MRKLVVAVSTLTFLSLGSVTLADDHQPMARAASVLDRTIATGKLNFAVAAVGDARGQTWSHAAGYQDETRRPERETNRLCWFHLSP